MSTLYRNYRPQKFSDILGQNHLKISLQNEIANNTLAHAYLFCGPRAVGKTSMARVLAQAVNCENRPDGDFEPCGQCQSCLNIKQGRALDVVEIDAASNTGVDNVRDNIISSVRVTPSYLKMKVFIIDEVHMLTLQAFNALLKTLEEPPSHILFILCTTEAHKVPLTIISRCQRFDFKRISPQEIVKKLKSIVSSEKIEVDKSVLEGIAKQSGGHLRDAESLLGQVLALGEKKITAEMAELILPRHNQHEATDLINALYHNDAATAISIVNNLAENGVNFKIFLDDILFILRKIMLQNLQPGLATSLGLDLGEELELKVLDISKNISTANNVRILKSFILLAKDSGNNFSQLNFEISIAELCLLEKTASFMPIVNRTTEEIATNESALSSTEKQLPPVEKKQAANLSQAEVQSRWPEVLVKIKKHNHSLSFIMQNCQASAINNGSIMLTFKYKFHRDRIVSSDIKEITEATLSEVYGGKLLFEAILDEKLELEHITKKEVELDNEALKSLESNNRKTNDASALGSLLANFGGETL